MADGRDDDAPAYPFRRAFLWTELFRSFQVALDPRKLLVAAAGIVVMSLGWYVLSTIFYRNAPDRRDEAYSVERMKEEVGPNEPGGSRPLEEADYRRAGDERFVKDHAEWQVLQQLAGPNGRLRTMPWYEYRGPNPYTFATGLLAGSAAERQEVATKFVSGTLPVLVEPLVKFLIPVVKLFDPVASAGTRFYLILCVLWFLATWAFFGGVITRIAAVQLSGKDRVSLRQAVQFVCRRYVAYLMSPIVPLGVVAFVVLGLMVFALFGLIPIVGDVLLYGLLLPVVILAGVMMAVLIVGLVGYPLMYTTLSTEGSDTFDALSRSYNYVFQAPWNYLWYSFLAVLYGAAVTLFVLLVGSMMVYFGKWAVTQTADLFGAERRRPDFLYVYAPESFGWKELLLKDSPIAFAENERVDEGRRIVTYSPVNQKVYDSYTNAYRPWNHLGAWMVTFWLVLAFLLMLGFTYSYYWSAAAVIYLLMRQKVDETELDEVYLEEDEPEAPVAPPPAKPADAAPAGGASLPMVPPPTPAQPLPSPAAGKFTGPVAAAGTPAAASPDSVPPPAEPVKPVDYKVVDVKTVDVKSTAITPSDPAKPLDPKPDAGEPK